MVKLSVVLLVTFMITLSVAKPVRWKMCGDDKTPFQQIRMAHEPEILKPGMDFIIRGWSKNISPTPITNGITTSRTFKYGIEVRVQRHSICDSVQGGCPVQPGEMLSVSRNNIPS